MDKRLFDENDEVTNFGLFIIFGFLFLLIIAIYLYTFNFYYYIRFLIFYKAIHSTYQAFLFNLPFESYNKKVKKTYFEYERKWVVGAFASVVFVE